MPSRTRLVAAVAIAAAVLAACGGDNQRRGADRATPTTATTVKMKPTKTDQTAAPKPAPTTSAKYTITAKNIAFAPGILSIPAGEDIEITLDNRDAAVPHNIHFMTPKEAKTDVEVGKASGTKSTVHVKVDAPGKYEFTCDVHPTMKGELVVQ